MRSTSNLPLSLASSAHRRQPAFIVVAGIVVFLAVAMRATVAEDPPRRNQADSGGASEAESARVQTFLESRYKVSDVQHTFRTKLGDTIDCIDFSAQPGVRALAARGNPIPKLPPSATRPPGLDLLFDGRPDENGSLRQCPEGTVPEVRITPQQIQSAGGLDAYLSHIHKFPFTMPSRTFPTRSQRQVFGQKASPPEPGLPGYAHTYVAGSGSSYTSGLAALSIFDPSTTGWTSGDHSLLQTWTITGSKNATSTPCPSNCRQTVEAGPIVSPSIFFDSKPHLFVYSTPDGYWTGCYNGSIPSNVSGTTACPNWVGLPSSYPPGVTLPWTVAGNLQEIFVWVGRCSFYNECQNGWEIRVSVDLDGQHFVPVGYYPDSNFSGFGTAASFLAGSEVFQTSALPSDTLFTNPMGSGSVATAGLGKAAYVANLLWTSTSGTGTYFNAGFGAPFSTVPKIYGVWENPNPGNEEVDLGIDYYLGAAAPASPPPPPAPVCKPQTATPSDQFYVNPNNNPVQVDAGSTGEVNLILDGLWITADHGNNAVGQITFDNLPSGSSVLTLPAAADNLGHSYALMQFLVTVPASASSGSYIVNVKATDAASCVSQTTTVPVQVLACAPQMACPASAAKSCGAISNGCGGTINCGACGSGQVCSNSFCCPAGTVYNSWLNSCASSGSWPPSCPSGKSFCYDLGACATVEACNRAANCQKVGAIKECQ